MGGARGGVITRFLLVWATIIVVVQGHGTTGHTHTHEGAAEGKHDSAFQNTNIVRDAAHIKEHLGDKVDQKHIDQMSPEELQFQFFAAHDLNGDGRLDGLEVYWSLEHAVEHLNIAGTMAEEQIADLTDDVLNGQDISRDGYLDYREYSLAHKNAALAVQQQRPHPAQFQGQGQHQGQFQGQPQGQFQAQGQPQGQFQAQGQPQGQGQGQAQMQGQIQGQGQVQGEIQTADKRQDVAQATATPQAQGNQGNQGL